MKTGIFIILLMALMSCQKEEPFEYAQEKNCIYFKDKTLERNFADMTVKIGGRDTYIGDSLRTDTVQMAVSLLGYRADYAREIFFRTIPLTGQDSSRLADIEILSTCFLDSAKAEARVKVVLHRPEERQENFVIGLTFDIGKTDFDMGAYENQICKITLRDRYTKPLEWDDFFITYLGEWSASKHAFVLTYFQSKTIPGNKSPLAWTRMYYPRIKAALEEYNAAYPDNPKDFTFPEL